MTQHVTIVGGGPAGLLTAIGLAKAGTKVTVLEANETFNDSPRAVAYHYPVLPYLDRLGVLQDCLKEGIARQDYAWRIHETGEMIRWDMKCLDGRVEHPYAMLLHQGLLSEILERHVKLLENVEVRYSTKLTGAVQNTDKVIAEVESSNGPEKIETDYLVGADGATSTVRQEILGYNFFGITWPQRYLALNVYVDLDPWDFRNIAMQVDHQHGGVICKLAKPDFWRITFMEDPELPMEGIEKRIDKVLADHIPADDYKVDAYAPYRMHQRVTDRMRDRRILLVGDSAHVTNPTGGLGLTGGMFDAFALTEALNRVIHDGAGDDMLEFYERDRRRVFIEQTSPRASENLRTMYYTKPGQSKEDFIAMIRGIGKSDDKMREAFGFTELMETKFQ